MPITKPRALVSARQAEMVACGEGEFVVVDGMNHRPISKEV